MEKMNSDKPCVMARDFEAISLKDACGQEIKHIIFIIVCCVILSNAVFTRVSAKDYGKSMYNKTRWENIKVDYLDSDADRLIFVKYKGGSKATVEMWKKVSNTSVSSGEQAEGNVGIIDNSWKRILSCNAKVGKKGINKKKEGDRKTPTGIYNITMAFGRKKSPGTAGIPYTKLNKYHYWSDEKATYNTFVDVRDLGRKKMSGEHLIKYNPGYNYVLALDYNKKCTYRKGSAIFLHCMKSKEKYTLGCVTVSEKNMKKIMQNTTTETKICIYRK